MYVSSIKSLVRKAYWGRSSFFHFLGVVSSLLDYVAQQAKDKLTISFVKAFLECS